MVDDLIIEEGDLEILHDHMRDVASGLQSVSVVTAGDYISSGVGGSKLAGLGRSADEAIDDAAVAVSCDLDDFPQPVDDLINVYNATENDAAVTFQQTAHGGPVMTMNDLRRKMEEQ